MLSGQLKAWAAQTEFRIMARRTAAKCGKTDASSSILIVKADLKLPEHQEAVLAMVDAYSRDSMGDAKPLEPDVRKRLVPALQKQPTTLIFPLTAVRKQWSEYFKGTLFSQLCAQTHV
jgi:hypothetical protein